jgi:hypothetical protein
MFQTADDFAGMKLGYHNTIDGLPSKWGADTTIRRFSTNSHNWLGGISKIKIDSDNFRYEIGVDVRTYEALHRRGPETDVPGSRWIYFHNKWFWISLEMETE